MSTAVFVARLLLTVQTMTNVVLRFCFPFCLFIFLQVEDMIKEVDVDGDGRIDFYEFVHALGEPEDSQENEDEEENTTSPLPTPKSNVSITYD